MAQIHVHPDGLVYVRAGGREYVDTRENFAADYGTPLPDLAGHDELVYIPGQKHALKTRTGETPGAVDWLEGDDIIASLASLIAAKAAREDAGLSAVDVASAKAGAFQAEAARRISELVPWLNTWERVEFLFELYSASVITKSRVDSNAALSKAKDIYLFAIDANADLAGKSKADIRAVDPATYTHPGKGAWPK